MANHWCVTGLAAVALLCCLAGEGVEAQNKGGYPPQPQNPQYPQYPSPPKYPPQYPPQYPPTAAPYPPVKYPPQYPPQYPPTAAPYPPVKYPPQYPPKYPPQYPPQYPPTAAPYPPKYPPQYPPQYPPTAVPYPPKYPPKYPPQYPPQYPPTAAPYPPKYPPQYPYGDQPVKNPSYPPENTKTPQMPPAPPKTCNVDTNVRVPCGVPGITATECDARDCCYDGQSCYFGNGVTLQCTKDGHFIVIVARDVTLPYIDLESIALLGQGPGCTAADSNSQFAIYYFPVTACGTVVTDEPGAITYQNKMTSSYEVGVGPYGAITRDSSYELVVQCKYIGTSVETLIVEVAVADAPLPIAVIGPINVELRIANGVCSTKGCNEVAAAYTSYYADSDYPVTKILRDPVYVEVELMDKTDPALVLTLGRCWTTTTPNPHSLPQWDILINGCPYADDRYLSSLVPVDASSGVQYPSHYERFIFKMFTFVDRSTMEPLQQNIYIHCSTAVCVPGPGVSCEPSCHTKGKRDTKSAEQKKTAPKVVVSSKAMIMSAPEQ